MQCVAAGFSPPPFFFLSCCATQLGLREHAAPGGSSLVCLCPPGADGAPGVGFRIPASPVRGDGACPVCSAEPVPLHRAHLQHRAQRGGETPLRTGVQ